MKKLIIICCLGLVFAKNMLPDINKEKVAQLDKEWIGFWNLLWRSSGRPSGVCGWVGRLF